MGEPLTLRDELVAIRARLKELHREHHDHTSWLGIAATEIGDAMKELPRAVLLKAGLEPARGVAPAASEGERGTRSPEPTGTPGGPAVREEAPCNDAAQGRARAGGAGGEVAAAVPAPPADGPPPAPARKPCSKCGGTDHDARRHNGKREPATAPPAEAPASDDEEPDPAPAELEAHAAAFEMTPEIDIPIRRRVPAAWDRSDPEQDLTDLDLGAPEPEAPATAPEANGVDRTIEQCWGCGKLGHRRNKCPNLNSAPETAGAPILVAPARPVELIEGEADPTAAQARVRAKLRVVDGRVRAKTITAVGPAGVLHRDERAAADDELDPSAYDRPPERGDCEAGGTNAARPCPWVTCPHHLALDVNDETGSFKLNFPHLEIWEMAETCSLDVADRGGITLEEVGAILNLTRERIRQVEVRGLAKIKDASGDELGLAPERGDGYSSNPAAGSSRRNGAA